MILAIIFLITDLFMVGIAYAVYGRTAVAGYSDGMVLGVHIRREKQEDPVLVEFMKNYKKDFFNIPDDFIVRKTEEDKLPKYRTEFMHDRN